MMNYIFSYFTGKNAPVYFPGAAMITAAILIIVALILVVPLMKKLSTK
jgi:hypothetical protein